MAKAKKRKLNQDSQLIAKRKEEIDARIEELKQNKFISGALLLILPVLFGVFGIMMHFGNSKPLEPLETPKTIVESIVSESQQVKDEHKPLSGTKNSKSSKTEMPMNSPSEIKKSENNSSETLKAQNVNERQTDHSKTKSSKTTKKPIPKEDMQNEKGVNLKDSVEEDPSHKLLTEFSPSILDQLQPGSVEVNGRTVTAVEIKPERDHNSSVRIYKIENFLSDRECDGLMGVHIKHVQEAVKNPPIICFDSISTLRRHLQENDVKWKVTEKDFTEGTTCLNASLSEDLKRVLKWSYSTAFYPMESPFTKIFEDRVFQATGLTQSNGGKFQITSYRPGIGYKSHTDCILESSELRDRFATILVYLQDVPQGGETEFIDLEISVKPKRGMAIFWNNMDSKGNCEPLSLHRAGEVREGHKFILQRWYYYKSFYQLGKRPPEPHLPQREPNTAQVSCDEYEHGSCRWYDEWNYDHITEYKKNKMNLV